MQFSFSESARKDLKKLPKLFQSRLKTKLLYWQGTENPLEFASPLINYPGATHRFRVGAYRLIVLLKSDNEMLVLRIRHRKDVYK
ncbi:MAG TPA: type II toxin-antitoxin system RelE/ParE family toxin [Candidatus Binatia bacterium]|jgi:mRNA-degrading endonuclease RelE of RelBE toxin-antitoxin system|nr:type II toxin-antitoxin system RelE/ParE family toxin [Candidatus Binatia bacterium]